MKNVRVVLSEDAKKVYSYLNSKAENSKTERMILKSINEKIEFIKNNMQYGDAIAKNLIPEEFKIKYNVKNLYRVELPAFWRMIYTVVDNEKVEVVAFVLTISDHQSYNKLFGYRKK